MSALPSLSNTPSPVSPASSQAGSAASTGDDHAVSFEAVLEAQLGLAPVSAAVLLPGAETDGAPGVPDLEDADPSNGSAPPTDTAQFLFLPVSLPGLQPVVLTAPVAHGDAAQDDRQAAVRASLPVPGEFEPPPSEAVAIPAQGLGFRQTEPANFAAELQRLPVAPVGGDRESAAPAAPLGAPLPNVDRRTETPQPAQQVIPGTVGEQRWGDALSQRVVWMVGQQVRAAEFRVEPPHLGPIEVRLSITNDQATLSFAAPHSGARDAIQTALPRLQEMLLENGLTLGDVFVGAQNQQDPREPATGGRESSFGNIPAAREAAGSSPDATMQVRRSLGLVDLYA